MQVNKPLKVYVLDDDRTTRLSVGGMLQSISNKENYNFEVEQLGSPRELGNALAKEDGSKFLLVISDGNMMGSYDSDRNNPGLTEDKLEFSTDHYNIDGTLEVLNKWIQIDPEKRQHITVLYSADVKAEEEFDFQKESINANVCPVNALGKDKIFKISKSGYEKLKIFSALLKYLDTIVKLKEPDLV